MAMVTYNAIGEKLTDNAEILMTAILAVAGTSVRVAPFNDEILTRLGVWIRGDSEEVEKVVEEMQKILDKKKVSVDFIQWQSGPERG